MSKQITSHRPWVFLLTITGLLMLVTFVAPGSAQNGIGERYNARDPQACSKAGSKSRAPTVAEAVASVICNSEHEAGIETLFLVDEVKVAQVGKGSPYKRGVDIGVADIDVAFLIYPIRGSFKKFQCTLSDGKTPEKNCLLYEHQNAEGRCYKNGFGQWMCGMSDSSVRESIKVFPPGSTRGAAASGKDKPATTKNNDQAAVKTDENGFPKPDLSEMEKYFEIVRTDYEFKLGRFNMLVKATKKTNIFQWYLTFYDADGIKVMDRSLNGSMGSPELGEPTKIYGYAPTEKEMKQVTRIVITRRIE